MKYKVGDKIKIVRATAGCYGAEGKIGTVTNEPSTDDGDAGNENYLARSFKCLSDGIYELNELKRLDQISSISDEDLLKVAEHMEAMMKILEKYKEK